MITPNLQCLPILPRVHPSTPDMSKVMITPYLQRLPILPRVPPPLNPRYVKGHDHSLPPVFAITLQGSTLQPQICQRSWSLHTYSVCHYTTGVHPLTSVIFKESWSLFKGPPFNYSNIQIVTITPRGPPLNPRYVKGHDHSIPPVFANTSQGSTP